MKDLPFLISPLIYFLSYIFYQNRVEFPIGRLTILASVICAMCTNFMSKLCIFQRLQNYNSNLLEKRARILYIIRKKKGVKPKESLTPGYKVTEHVRANQSRFIKRVYLRLEIRAKRMPILRTTHQLTTVTPHPSLPEIYEIP